MCCRAFSTITNMNFDKGPLLAMLQRVMDERKKIAPTWEISLAQTLLFGLKGTSAYADHAAILGHESDDAYRGILTPWLLGLTALRRT